MELSSSKIFFLYFRKWNFLASYLSYISGVQKNSLKNFLIFQEMELYMFSKKKFTFQEETCKAQETKISYVSEKIPVKLVQQQGKIPMK